MGMITPSWEHLLNSAVFAHDNRRFYWNSSFDSIPKGVVVNSALFCDGYYWQHMFADLYLRCAAAVSSLFFSRRPLTVARVIAFVIVDAIYSCIRRWSPAHVMQERRKRAFPFFAYGDASTAIVRILGVRRIVAASNNMVPYTILRNIAQPMRAFSCCGQFFVKASATFNVAPAQIPQRHFFGISARTLAQPPAVCVGSNVRDYDKPAKNCSCYVDDSSAWNKRIHSVRGRLVARLEHIVLGLMSQRAS